MVKLYLVFRACYERFNMKTYFDLFFAFFKIGALTFGGGYAMLPMFKKELVEKRNWCTQEDILDYYAIAQCTPGVIAVNTASFVGMKQKGILGAIFATLGVVAPSILIISIIAAFVKEFNDKTAQQAGFIIPVVITIFDDRSFTFELKTPPAAVLIKKAIGLDKGSAKPNKTKVGKITKEQIRNIATSL